jgi:GNAT superfamily N-acetyltransferase
MQIRLARPDDIARLIEIEASGGALFEALGMTLPVLLEPPTANDFTGPVDEDRVWLMAGDDGVPVAHIRTEAVDGNAHLSQVSVHIDNARRGFGRLLIDHVVALSLAQGFTEMTLTTYCDVPWNGPYYERLGWRRLADADLGPQLAAIRAEERSVGLDTWPRTAMTRKITTVSDR